MEGPTRVSGRTQISRPKFGNENQFLQTFLSQDQKPPFLTPAHHAKGVPASDISRTSPPLARKNSAIRLALMAAPRQLLPATAGSNPSNAAVVRLRDRS